MTMGIITLKIDDAIEERLRKKIGRDRGAARGAISSSVEEAIEAWLNYRAEEIYQPKRTAQRSYVAKKDKVLAEAETLEALSVKIKDLGFDPRSIIIESIPSPPLVRKMGLRVAGRKSDTN